MDPVDKVQNDGSPPVHTRACVCVWVGVRCVCVCGGGGGEGGMCVGAGSVLGDVCLYVYFICACVGMCMYLYIQTNVYT